MGSLYGLTWNGCFSGKSGSKAVFIKIVIIASPVGHCLRCVNSDLISFLWTCYVGGEGYQGGRILLLTLITSFSLLVTVSSLRLDYKVNLERYTFENRST